MKIFLGDLTHNYKVVSNETMPLGVALIKAVLVKHLGSDVHCKLFRYPDKLLDAIKREMPDVLMLSNYVWNESLSYYVFTKFKRLNPSGLTVMGGPNLSLDSVKREQFMRTHPNLDIYVIGEGEQASLEIVRSFINIGGSINELKKKNLPSCIYIKHDGTYHQGNLMPRIENLEEIPSPWLEGYLDDFFDGKLAPIIETTRGCPFTCAFCVMGSQYYHKIRHFPIERVKEEIHYIAKKIKTKSPSIGYLRITDSNFGMLKYDVAVSEVIADVQKQYGWPTFIDATTGKNNHENIIKTVSNLKGTLVMYNSVQSMSAQVLENIKRKNINPNLLMEIQDQIGQSNIKSLTETILSLPGESLDSHIEGLFKLMDLGFKQFTNYQCMVLKGSLLETEEVRNAFNIETQFRILPRSFGIYGGDRVVEIEEIISSTSTLSFKDYLRARQFHLILIIYFNGFRFEPLIRFMQYYGITLQIWLNLLFQNINTGPKEIAAVFEMFSEETAGELYNSHKACMDFYLEVDNFERMENGEIGGNLLMKYYSEAMFNHWVKVVNFALDTAETLLKNEDYNEKFLHDLRIFMRNRVACGQTEDEILASTKDFLGYDIVRWINEGFMNNFNEYAYNTPRLTIFYLPTEKLQIMKNALRVYGSDTIGKSKLVTRIQYADQVRDCMEASSSQA